MIRTSSEKQKLAIILAILAFVSITLPFLTPRSSALSTSSTEPRIFTIIVSRNGFNGTADSLSITVQQGETVNITFLYGDNDLPVDNPHAIMIDGYGIKTVNIDRANPTVNVEFVADTSGTFNFYCYIPCVGMENLLGHMIVIPTQSQGTASSLDLAVSNTNPQSGSFLISATVKDMSNQPLIAVPVKFYENTSFGELWLGTVPTDSKGVAILNYTSLRIGTVQIIAENPSSAQYMSGSKSISITIPSRATETVAEGQIYLGVRQPSQTTGIFYGISYPPNLAMIGVPRLTNIITITLVGAVILGVWSTYAYLGRQIAGLPRNGKLDQEETEIPQLNTPIVGSGAIETKIAPDANKVVMRLALVPLLGVLDVVLVNGLGLPILTRGLSLIGLAVLETLTIVAFVTSNISNN